MIACLFLGHDLMRVTRQQLSLIAIKETPESDTIIELDLCKRCHAVVWMRRPLREEEKHILRIDVQQL
jgi:hypothetical protein